MTIYINRQYEDADVLARLVEVVPGLNFGERGRLTDVESEPATSNMAYRTVTLTVELPLTRDDFERVFSNPVG